MAIVETKATLFDVRDVRVEPRGRGGGGDVVGLGDELRAGSVVVLTWRAKIEWIYYGCVAEEDKNGYIYC